VFTLTVPGQPVPQPRPRVSTRGGFGRAYTPSRHPIHAYRAAIQAAAIAAGKKTGRGGAVRLTIEAVFARPASHWTLTGLSKSAKPWPRADGDNVAKGVQDALTDAGVWDDDDCVLDMRIVKRYAARGEAAKTVITITEFAP
jgi:Holliday junction resolvase RusA-like endonuclease